MIEVDRPTERRNAAIQYVVVAVTAAVLLNFVVADKRLYVLLLGPLLLIVLYSSWKAERLSPTQARSYGHAAVTGAADVIADAFRSDPWLLSTWPEAPIDRLLVVPPDGIAAGMAVLRAAGPYVRPLTAAVRVANRLGAAVLGLALGGVLGHSASVLGLGGLSLGWPAATAFVLLVTFRLYAATRNRRRRARLAVTMRASAREVLKVLLDPPWANHKAAIAQELQRLLDGPGPRRLPELRVTNLLLAAGGMAGLMAGWIA